MTSRRFAAAGAVSFLLAGLCHADDIQTRIARDETVTSRAHPETDPLGIRLGAFILDPDATIGTSYTDNVYATNQDTVGDMLSKAAAKAALKSDWSNNFLALTVNDQQTLYTRHATEDTNDYGADANGRLDITQSDRITFDSSYISAHEPRTSPNNVFGKSPTNLSEEKIAIGSFDKFNRLSVNLDATAAKYEYTDVPTSIGSFITERDRDRWEDGASLRLGYEILPEYEAVLRASFDDHSYIHTRDSQGFERSSRGETVTAGLAFDLTGVTFGEIGAGFLNTAYQDPRFSSLQGLSAKVSLTWNATPLMTVRLDGARDLAESVQVGSPGVLNETAILTIDHELLRNLLLTGKVGIVDARYLNITQHQVTLTDAFGATYLLNRNMRVIARYDRTNCDSNIQLSTFTQNIVSLSIKLML